MENSNAKAAFMGKVTASVTHEIQNVLAIIKETSGLLEDFMLMNQGELSDMDERFDRCLKTIKKQAYRGVVLTSGLNSFAHTPDNPVRSIGIFEFTRKILAITERLFSQKGFSVSIIENAKPCSISTDPVLFQMLVVACIECLMETFPPGGPIIVTLTPPDNPTALVFSYKDTEVPRQNDRETITKSQAWEGILGLCDPLGLIPETTPDLPGICIFLK